MNFQKLTKKKGFVLNDEKIHIVDFFIYYIIRK